MISNPRYKFTVSRDFSGPLNVSISLQFPFHTYVGNTYEFIVVAITSVLSA